MGYSLVIKCMNNKPISILFTECKDYINQNKTKEATEVLSVISGRKLTGSSKELFLILKEKLNLVTSEENDEGLNPLSGIRLQTIRTNNLQISQKNEKYNGKLKEWLSLFSKPSGKKLCMPFINKYHTIIQNPLQIKFDVFQNDIGIVERFGSAYRLCLKNQFEYSCKLSGNKKILLTLSDNELHNNSIVITDINNDQCSFEKTLIDDKCIFEFGLLGNSFQMSNLLENSFLYELKEITQ